MALTLSRMFSKKNKMISGASVLASFYVWFFKDNLSHDISY